MQHKKLVLVFTGLNQILTFKTKDKQKKMHLIQIRVWHIREKKERKKKDLKRQYKSLGMNKITSQLSSEFKSKHFNFLKHVHVYNMEIYIF